MYETENGFEQFSQQMACRLDLSRSMRRCALPVTWTEIESHAPGTTSKPSHWTEIESKAPGTTEKPSDQHEGDRRPFSVTMSSSVFSQAATEDMQLHLDDDDASDASAADKGLQSANANAAEPTLTRPAAQRSELSAMETRSQCWYLAQLSCHARTLFGKLAASAATKISRTFSRTKQKTSRSEVSPWLGPLAESGMYMPQAHEKFGSVMMALEMAAEELSIGSAESGSKRDLKLFTSFAGNLHKELCTSRTDTEYMHDRLQDTRRPISSGSLGSELCVSQADTENLADAFEDENDSSDGRDSEERSSICGEDSDSQAWSSGPAIATALPSDSHCAMLGDAEWTRDAWDVETLALGDHELTIIPEGAVAELTDRSELSDNWFAGRPLGPTL